MSPAVPGVVVAVREEGSALSMAMACAGCIEPCAQEPSLVMRTTASLLARLSVSAVSQHVLAPTGPLVAILPLQTLRACRGKRLAPRSTVVSWRLFRHRDMDARRTKNTNDSRGGEINVGFHKVEEIGLRGVGLRRFRPGCGTLGRM